MQDPASGELHVKIQTPEGVVWEGNAEAVSSHNSVGAFDILPEHANFVTLIESQSIIVVSPTGTRDFNFKRAVMSLKDNTVSIYADIAQSTSEERSK